MKFKSTMATTMYYLADLYNLLLSTSSNQALTVFIIAKSWTRVASKALLYTNLPYNRKTMSFSNIRHHVLFGWINLHGPCVCKVSFFVGQFSFPISRVVPTCTSELRPSTRPTPIYGDGGDCQASSCQGTGLISHIFGPKIGDRSVEGIRRRISP